MLGSKIYSLRKERGLTQMMLADLVGVSNKAVSKWETDEANPEVSNLPRLAEVLGVSISELFDEDTAQKKSVEPAQTKITQEKQWVIEAERKKGENIFIKVLLVGAFLFALAFIGTGLGVFLGFAVPESRDLAVATNTSYPIHTVVVTRAIRSSATVNDERMYRIEFDWEGGTERTRPIYTGIQANAMVGQEISIRISDAGRIVPVDFERSDLSIIGWVFLGVFGGIGLFTIIGIIVTIVLITSKNRAAKQDESEYGAWSRRN